jgi:hypothetical protein
VLPEDPEEPELPVDPEDPEEPDEPDGEAPAEGLASPEPFEELEPPPSEPVPVVLLSVLAAALSPEPVEGRLSVL